MSSAVKQVSRKFGGALLNFKKSGRRTFYTYSNEPSQPLKGRAPEWVTAEQAFDKILKSGMNNKLLIQIILFIIVNRLKSKLIAISIHLQTFQRLQNKLVDTVMVSIFLILNVYCL